jgi:hypothetical protein
MVIHCGNFTNFTSSLALFWPFAWSLCYIHKITSQISMSFDNSICTTCNKRRMHVAIMTKPFTCDLHCLVKNYISNCWANVHEVPWHTIIIDSFIKCIYKMGMHVTYHGKIVNSLKAIHSPNSNYFWYNCTHTLFLMGLQFSFNVVVITGVNLMFIVINHHSKLSIHACVL